MKDFYEQFYAVVATSPVHAEFCERVFGRNLSQHGFSDMAQLEALLHVTGLGPGMQALDLGCGSGMVAEYLSDCTGAHITGLDYIDLAIQQAQARTAAKADHLQFFTADLNALDLPPRTYDVILSIDTLYFSADLTGTIGQLVQALRPGGQMAIFYAHGREPWVPLDEFQADTLAPDRTPLGAALCANGLAFQALDFTAEEYRLARLRQEVLAELRPRFEAEGLMFIYDNRSGDAQGIRQAIEDGLHRRYLYHVRLSD
ncbi:MAG: methyltransferase domain-containing protein [Anaerolineae bacterium]|nr:methyltransferase domain-containing protein [Anaerolineae bacterium]